MYLRSTLVAAVAAALVGMPALAAPSVDIDIHAPRPDVVRFDGQAVVRVMTRTEGELAKVIELGEGVWSERVGVGPLDVQIRKDRLGELTKLGIAYTVLNDDLQASVDAEWNELQRLDLASKKPGVLKDGADITWFQAYKQVGEIHTYLNGLATARPDLASTAVVGQSHENRDIVAITITGPDQPGNLRADRPVVMWQGCQHAREWVSPMTVTYLADQLVELYDTDSRVRGLVDTVEFVIVPMVNPDGYAYTWSNYRFWRKNRTGVDGTDLNRNWSYEWGGLGASTDPYSDTYRGTGPFSEPETQVIRDLCISYGTRLKSVIDYHSYSQLLLWPWGYGYVQAPEPDRTFYIDLCADMSQAIQTTHGVFYTPQHSADLYPASGDSVDWFYGDRGAKSITIELRDTGANGFDLPADQIIPTAEENWAAALIWAEATTQALRITPVDAIPTVVLAGQTTEVRVDVIAGAEPVDPASPVLHVSVDGGAYSDAAMSHVSGDTYSGLLPSATCGQTLDFYISASSTTGTQVSLPAGGASGAFSADAVELAVAFFDDMQTSTGWTVGASGDTASTGVWQRGDPVGTGAQPGDDHTAVGTFCWATGLSGSSLGSNDVDGGATTLTSPAFDATTGSGDAYISYWRWYSNDQGGSPNADSMPVEISNDDGASWTQLELVADNANAWVYREWRVADVFTTPSDQVRVKFVPSDLGSGSIVEAAVDDVSLEFRGCSGSIIDLNGDGVIDAGDLSLFITYFLASDLAVDFTGDGIVDSGDLGLFVTLFLDQAGG